MRDELIDFLKELVTDDRLALFYKKLAERTRYITIAVEDLYQTHNTSAVLRSCECFGVQDVHVVEQDYSYQVNEDIALGSANWIDIIRYNSTQNNSIEAITSLKQKGYRIVATTPHTNDVNLEDFNIEKGKAAFFFGTELTGLSQTVLDNADEFMKIPMYGFTESFNISVSVGIIMHQLTQKLRHSSINWHLTHNEKQDILLQWLTYSIRFGNKVIDEFYKRKGIKTENIEK